MTRCRLYDVNGFYLLKKKNDHTVDLNHYSKSYNYHCIDSSCVCFFLSKFLMCYIYLFIYIQLSLFYYHVEPLALGAAYAFCFGQMGLHRLDRPPDGSSWALLHDGIGVVLPRHIRL